MCVEHLINTKNSGYTSTYSIVQMLISVFYFAQIFIFLSVKCEYKFNCDLKEAIVLRYNHVAITCSTSFASTGRHTYILVCKLLLPVLVLRTTDTV